MKKLVIIYNSGAKTTIKNTKKMYTNGLFKRYLKEYCEPASNVRSAILYTYPLKSNESLVLIENGQIVNEI